jgi:hypothetical protein
MQRGDVPATFADVDDLMREVNFRPGTIAEGIARFIDWYRICETLVPAMNNDDARIGSCQAIGL